MTLDEAIYCMKSYLPDETVEHCFNCPYYASKQIDEYTFLCESSTAHRMAIDALKRMKEELCTKI